MILFAIWAGRRSSWRLALVAMGVLSLGLVSTGGAH